MSDAKGMGIEGYGTEGSYHVSDDDKNLSQNHLEDSLEFNIHHAEDHLKEAKKACERLHKIGEKPKIPKSLIDCLRYFEKKDENAATMPIERLREKLK